MKTLEVKTKRDFVNFAKERGFYTRYSGKLKRFFLTHHGFNVDIHNIINKKATEL